MTLSESFSKSNDDITHTYKYTGVTEAVKWTEVTRERQNTVRRRKGRMMTKETRRGVDQEGSSLNKEVGNMKGKIKSGEKKSLNSESAEKGEVRDKKLLISFLDTNW